MTKFLLLTLVLGLFSGCAPKMGKDVLIEPEGNLRWENSKSEVVLGVLSLLGAPADREPIRIGTDVKITNRWHSEMKLKSLTCSLVEGEKLVATGSAYIDPIKGFSVAPDTRRVLPLSVALDPKIITLNRLFAIMQEKSRMTIQGEAVVEVWGAEYRYPFSKDVTALIAKALNGKEKKVSRQ